MMPPYILLVIVECMYKVFGIYKLYKATINVMQILSYRKCNALDGATSINIFDAC